MAATERTVLSAGLVINALLRSSEAVGAFFEGEPRIYPVVSMTEDEFPCIAYARTGLAGVPVKSRHQAETGTVSVQVYSRSYAEAVVLAEAVRDTLDGSQYRDEELYMRMCTLVDASEDAFTNGVYVEELIFEVKI